MDQSDRAVDGGGGAMFHGDIIAGRDVTINHFTEIRQVTEHLYNRCGAAEDVSENLLGRLDVLNGTAEFVEEYAKELQARVPPNDPQLQKIFHECASILSDLRILVALIEDSGSSNDADATGFSTISLNEDVMDIRFRLMNLQFNLSCVHNKKIEQDADIIKKAVTELMNGPANADDTSSVRTFYTASSVPYVERQTWRELERALSASLTAKFVRDNYSLIVAIVEDTVWENITPRPMDTIAPAPTVTMASELTNTTTPTLQGSEQSSTLPGDTDESAQGTTITERQIESAQTVLRQLLEELKFEFPALPERPLSITAINYDGPSADRSGRTWASCDDDSGGERLLTFDGGGVKSYSSVLIMEELMKEIARYENMFEKGFTNYPRNFNAAELRPCHYFDKMYGTSTGGIIAIALGRLRMTVPETMRAFREILTAMYTNPRTSIPLATKYSHSAFQEALNSMVNVNCKEHPNFLCGRDDTFPWRSTEEQDTNALCQTICLTAVYGGQVHEAHLIRTYDHHYDPDISPVWVTPYNEGAYDLTICQAARATTAAPIYFKMLEVFVGNPPVLMRFKDGGIRENNPSYCAFSEHSSLHGDDVEPSVLVSIGAGRPGTNLDAFHSVWPGPLGSSPLTKKYTDKLAVFKNVLIKEAEGQDRHKMMRTIARGEHRWYKRLSVTTGLEAMKLDLWEHGFWDEFDGLTTNHRGGKTINKIRIATEAYLNRDAEKTFFEYAPPREMLKQTAERLVRLRRTREFEAMTEGGEKREKWVTYMGKYLAGEQKSFQEYLAHWDYAMLGRKGSSTQNLSRD